jgi:tetratricopeptide (TPR) repeat protein
MLLLAALKTEPNNARYHFYLAQSYSDSGNHKGAIATYRKRIKLGGWVEELYISHLKLANSLLATGDDAGFIRTLLDAYNFRPSRAEAPWELAHYYRMKGKTAASILFSEPMLSLPYPKDSLFLNRYIHEVGLREEFSICAFYDPNKRAHGFKVCNDLALDKTEYAGARELARTNLFHYLEPLSKMAPSFNPKQLTFTPCDRVTFEPTGYKLLNPSVALVNKELYTIIRTVNYEIDKDGRYLIKNTETGEITNDNPIHTRNYLAKLSNELDIQTVAEILPPLLPKPEYPLVVGFEDMRLFEFQGDMWTSSTMRELNREGWCEQVLAKIDRSTAQLHIVEWHKMDDTSVRQHEKNWMPWVKYGAIRFAYHVNEVVDDYGRLVSKMPLGFSVDHFRGGSQVIPFHGGWLALIHEAGHHDNKRYYQHRFVWFCYNGLIQYISLPFVFHSKQIEFAAGLAWHPDKKRLVISYGVADKEAWVATVADHDIMEMLHP